MSAYENVLCEKLLSVRPSLSIRDKTVRWIFMKFGIDILMKFGIDVFKNCF